MDYTAALGPLAFRYVDAIHAVIPPFEPVTCLATADAEMATVCEGGRYFLVIDHRTSPWAAARAEFWAVNGAIEGPLEGLFVLADAAGPCAATAYFGGFTSLARRLSGAPHAGNSVTPVAS